MLVSQLSEFNLILSVGAGAFILLFPLAIMFSPFNRSPIHRKKTYDWYKAKYPNNVQKSFITCYRCETNSLEILPIVHEVFRNKVHCTQCNITLYYSH